MYRADYIIYFCFKSLQENEKYLIWCEITPCQEVIPISCRNSLYKV